MLYEMILKIVKTVSSDSFVLSNPRLKSWVTQKVTPFMNCFNSFSIS